MKLHEGLLVFAGGGSGAVLRFAIGSLFEATSKGATFPWATLSINLTGSLLMGLAMGFSSKQSWSDPTKVLIMVGVLGGYTTFSSFSKELVEMFQRGDTVPAALYASTSLAAGPLLCLLGLKLAAAAGP